MIMLMTVEQQKRRCIGDTISISSRPDDRFGEVEIDDLPESTNSEIANKKGTWVQLSSTLTVILILNIFMPPRPISLDFFET